MEEGEGSVHGGVGSTWEGPKHGGGVGGVNTWGRG